MSSFVIKYITNRLLKDNQWNRLGVEDPYHEYVDAKSSFGKPYKKRIARRIPEGISSNDTQVLQLFRKRAYKYDMWFLFLGIRFGWTNIVGLIPVVGTIVSTFWSLKLLVLARSLDNGFPLDLQLLFILNITIDFALGFIPIVGDLIEVGYKSNSRNYLLLEKHLTRVGMKNMGLIEEQDVRPSFINDKIQPVIEEKVIPAAKSAGSQFASKASSEIKHLVNRNPKSSNHESASIANSFDSSTSSIQISCSQPTTQTSETNVSSSHSK
jgi:uncharacterized membrane protein YwzB